MKYFASAIFFLTFFKISLFNQYAYISIIFGVIGGAAMFLRADLQKVIKKMGGHVFVSFLILSAYIFVIDIFSSNLLENKYRSFSVRMLSLCLVSFFPAYLIYRLLGADRASILKIIEWSFWLQFIFWLITYFNLDIKSLVYEIMGASESVNLRDYNLTVRGFGVSTEINYTTPFMMSLICFVFLKRTWLSLCTFITQIVNSGLVIFAFGIGLFFSRIEAYKKLLILLICGGLLFYLGDQFFVRLFAEIESGGTRTIDGLLAEHLIFLNEGGFEQIFGTGRYVFGGEENWRSDIGWVIIYNFGGLLGVVLFIYFIFSLGISALGTSWIAMAWIASGLVLNTKGILLGPNAYFFTTFLLCFCWKDSLISRNNVILNAKKISART